MSSEEEEEIRKQKKADTEYFHAYYLGHREQKAKYGREYYLAHRQQRADYYRKWRLEHRDYLAEQKTNWFKTRMLEAPEEVREQARQRERRYRLNHPERALGNVHKYQKTMRINALKKIARGNPLKCATCGCDIFELLQINHINGGGSKETDKLGETGFYRSIVTGERPIDDLDIRCEACNWLHFIQRKHPEVAGRFTLTFR